ncbi:MAG: hypothetical protein HYY57_06735 [Candidatus Omnitrophica bacterium]|nr:hypothetical protein [Candidatus Omnitrophota bacterium]
MRCLYGRGVSGAALFILMGLFPALALGKLAPSTWDDLISDSDLIVQASVAQLGPELLDMRLPRFAVLRVQRIFKGTYDPETVKIEFESEEHEQFMTTVPDDRLLFLKRTPDGKYTAARYGKSYWPLLWVEGEERKLAAPYIYPMNMISVPGTFIKQAVVNAPRLGLKKGQAEVIYLKEIIPWFNAVDFHLIAGFSVPDQSTPARTLRTFWWAIRNQNRQMALMCVDTNQVAMGRHGRDVEKFIAEYSRLDTRDFQFSSLGKRATIASPHHMMQYDMEQRRDGKWVIVSIHP